ncbi:MAG: DUF3833 family protein [Pseudomonadota bacterium]
MVRLIGVFLPFFLSVSLSAAFAQATVPAPRANPERLPTADIAPSSLSLAPVAPGGIAEEQTAEQLGLAPEATANLQKEFTLEGFFAGETVARGSISSKTVGVARSFRMRARGTWDGKVLTLVETYQYAFGQNEQRVWRFTKTGPDTYIAESSEIQEKAELKLNGRRAKLKYVKTFERGDDKEPIEITHRENWIFRENGLLEINVDLRKFVSVGREAINFVRVENEETLVAPKF